jgi:demethylmenaquinone methyltransferase/2-methoxy-6-polyprenyl-1,4-benzoquinol methylase
MFSDIAPRYDLLNHLLSFNVDRGWRKTLLRRIAPILRRPDSVVLDVCCGTGDVLIDLQNVSANPVLGADFCHPMLVTAMHKVRKLRCTPALFEADALELPLPANSLDAITIAFGFRNLADYRAGLAEFQRVLKPAGVLAILEFSHPPGLFMRTAYGLYAKVVLPLIGGLVSGSRAAYSYLPESVAKFPRAEELRGMFEQQGFVNTQFELLTGGIAALHTGEKVRAATAPSAG